MIILVTGAAGFIGYHTSLTLLRQGHTVIGIDNLNDYYSVTLKKYRLKELKIFPNFIFYKKDISNHRDMLAIAKNHSDISHIVHLAAQAGVRYSVDHPLTYVQSNLVGHMMILEMCRNLPQLQHLVYASSSSVYGNNNVIPFSTNDIVNAPRSLYAATKQCNEVLTYSYSYLYHIHATALRFFTVYGPAGRPDMAVYSFTKSIFENKPIQLFNNGNMKRDFTYVDDIVSGIIASLNHRPATTPPHAIYNLGHHQPVELATFVALLEAAIGKKAILEYKPMHPGDMEATCADITSTTENLGFIPKTSLAEGLKHFVAWYKNYYQC
jgi:UDP-glucuronate 4-epimerase